jgi:hypothetical protein
LIGVASSRPPTISFVREGGNYAHSATVVLRGT